MAKTYITDSVYGGIKIDDDLILELTNTKEFKRLGRIKHLGVSDFLYPSATHTRLAHSYGVYWLAKNAIDQLKGSNDIPQSTQRAVMAAGLLHDVGHGPLSHNFEMISNMHHEELTIQILDTKTTQVYEAFEKIDPQARVEAIQIINGEHPLQWCNQLISSEIDLDRMDYLMRDSQNSGTTYGNIDWKWVVRNMRIMDNKLVFKRKALPSIESILIARYHMNESIYHNYKNEAYAQLMPFFMNRLKQLHREGKLESQYNTLEPILNDDKTISVDEFHIMDDSSLLAAIRRGSTYEKDELLNKLALHYLDREQPTIVTDDLDEWEKQQKPELENITWRRYTIKEGWSFYKTGSKGEALILERDGKVYPASKVSSIIDRLSKLTLHQEHDIGVEIK